MSDNWQPSAPTAVLRLRARMLSRLRAFFDARNVLEVETPMLSQAATTEVHLQSFKIPHADSIAPPLYLHTSPELPMKRLLAAGSGDIYQVCKVFRAGEAGPKHNPEFTLLEWYRLGYQLPELIDESIELIRALLADEFVPNTTKRFSYIQLFQEYLDIDPREASSADLAAVFEGHTGQAMGMPRNAANKDAWLDLLLTHLIEPQFPGEQVTVVTDYPASQASLSKLNEHDPRVAQRFEIYLGSLELANGFNELTDAAEQRRRMQRDIIERKKLGLDVIPMDQRFLAALEHGLPACCGVAMGLDRLVMLAAGVDDIREVLAFAFDRA